MKKTLLTSSLIIGSVVASQAAMISINFGTNQQGTPLGSSVATDNYTSAIGTVTTWDYESNNDWSGSSATFTDNGQTINIRHDAGGVWRNTSTPSDQSVFRGYLDDNGGDSQNDIHLTGLSGWLTAAGATSYQVVILRSTDNATGFNPLTITTGDVTGETGWLSSATPTGGNTADTLWAGTSFGTGGTHTYESNVFTANQDGIALTFTRAGVNRGSVAGIVIVSVPEPSSAALLGLGGLALILRRRK